MRRLALLLVLAPALAHAQPGPQAVEQEPLAMVHQRLRDRYGVEVAARLLRSESADERLRGVARAAEIALPLAAGPEVCKTGGPSIPICEEAKRALELLTPAESGGALRDSSRMVLATARALAPFAAHAQARAALIDRVNAQPMPIARAREEGELDVAARTMFARGVAAMALATSHDTRATDALVAIARGGGIGQQAAVAALAANGMSFWSPAMPPPLSALAAQAIVKSGDLRALEQLRAAAKTGDAQTRAAALLGMGQLGDGRALELARAAIGEKDARLRAAAAEVFVLLDAGLGAQKPENDTRDRAVEALIKDEITAPYGVQLAERTQDEGVTNALAARAVATSDHAFRQAIVRALGMGTPPKAVQVLLALAERDPSLEADITQALARSPSPIATAALEKIAQAPAKRRLALRGYVVRRAVRGETSAALDAMLEAAARSSDAKDRAVGVPAMVLFGKMDMDAGLGDKDAAVRRATVSAALAVDAPRAQRALLQLLKDAQSNAALDPTTSAVFAAALAGGDPDGAVTSADLEQRASGSMADAPLAAFALARRVSDRPGDEPLQKKVLALLASPVAAVRAHVAMGLGASELPSAIGALAEVVSFEPDPDVRLAATVALGERAWQSAPVARRALESEAKLDPDADVRFAASRIVLGLKPPSAALVREVAWLRAHAADNAAPPKGLTGTIIPKHGVAIPFAFDDEGFALVFGVPVGEANVSLAPRVPGAK